MAGQASEDGCGWIIVLALIGAAYWYFKKPEPPAIYTQPVNQVTAPEAAEATLPKPAPTPAPAPPANNYNFREGTTYGYESAVSEEDQKKGVAAGDVLLYRYLGKIGGRHVLEQLSPTGAIVSTSSCDVPCNAIRLQYGGTTKLISYDIRSVVGSAMDDAIHGRLRVYHPKPVVARSPETDQPPETITTENFDQSSNGE